MISRIDRLIDRMNTALAMIAQGHEFKQWSEHYGRAYNRVCCIVTENTVLDWGFPSVFDLDRYRPTDTAVERVGK